MKRLTKSKMSPIRLKQRRSVRLVRTWGVRVRQDMMRLLYTPQWRDIVTWHGTPLSHAIETILFSGGLILIEDPNEAFLTQEMWIHYSRVISVGKPTRSLMLIVCLYIANVITQSCSYWFNSFMQQDPKKCQQYTIWKDHDANLFH